MSLKIISRNAGIIFMDLFIVYFYRIILDLKFVINRTVIKVDSGEIIEC